MRRRRPAPVALLLLPLGAVALATEGCGVVPFHQGYDIAEQRVPGDPLGGILTMPIDVNIDTESAGRDTGPADSVYLESFTLRITPTAEGPGDTDDFDFVDSIEVYIVGREGSTLPRVRIASIDNIPAGARTLSLQLDAQELLLYFQEGARIEADGTGTAPPDDVTFDGNLLFAIEVL